ncbi:uncharacterized protein LOC120421415 isoform X3 [Culex pipiens pallens]|uniref:uncharacterized protein LOC120421415 isoform X3 n=1 Tax=Culex pipiens pallens TaxID=42434 RepID=UPI0019537DB2|nr:uncharacterized protein LOC120421415 isoform X3 [Culex pipiens pallens]
MKQSVVLCVLLLCAVLGAVAFSGGQSAASGDPAPGRSPGPPGVEQLSDAEHRGEPLDGDGSSPTYLFTRDAAQDTRHSPLTSNDVLDGPEEDEEDQEVEEEEEEEDVGGPELVVGDVSSEPSLVEEEEEEERDDSGEIKAENQLRGPELPAGSTGCGQGVQDYLKAGDKIERIGGESETSGSKESLWVSVGHDLFEASNGIVPGVVYRVEVHRPKESDVRDFYIESLLLDGTTSGIPASHQPSHSALPPAGTFLDSNPLSNSLHPPGEGGPFPPSNTWIDDLEADWASGHPGKKPPPPPAEWNRWSLAGRRHKQKLDQLESGYFEEAGSEQDLDFDEEEKLPVDGRRCPSNVWRQDFMFQDRMVMNWSVPVVAAAAGSGDSGDNVEGSLDGSGGQRNRTVYFRILYRTMTSHIVYELIYTMVLLKECNLLLKDTSGSLDSGKLPAEYAGCRIGFPSRFEDNDDDDDDGQRPGLVVQLTRLNIPCRADGGYLRFLDDDSSSSESVSVSGGSVDGGRGEQLREELGGRLHLLCGKLEELPKHERTFHFQTHRNTSVLVYNRPVFSFNFRLVDYCYNVTLSDRNSTVLLRPRRGLDCRFKVHLPYGNRISLRLVANQGNTSTVTAPIKHEQIDLSQEEEDGFRTPCYSGLRVEVYEEALKNRWNRCVDSFSASTRYTLLSSDNSLVIHVSKHALLAALDAPANSSTLAVPSLLLEYSHVPVENVVAQCAFGWIASGQQFCVAPFENRPLSWLGAEGECNRRGGHLASIRSVADQKLVDQMLLKSPGYREGNAYWIGASDRVLEGDFRWTDNFPFTYSNWFPGWIQQGNYNRQPNDDGLSGQDCVEIRRQFQTPPGTSSSPQASPSSSASPLVDSYMWNDRDCDTRNFYICERVAVEEGLEQTWHADCNKTIQLTMDRPKMTIWSPGFPRSYPDNVNCLTMITAPPGYRIVLDFEELVLESEPLCAYDYLQIVEPPANLSSPYTKPARTHGPLFQTRNPRHSTNRGIRRRKSNATPSKIDVSDRLISTFANKSPNLILQPNDPSYDLTKPPPDLGSGRVPRKVCGDWSSKLKLLRHVTHGPLLALRFVSDYSNHFGGYKAKVAMENGRQWPRVISECYDERFKAYNASCYLFISYPEVDWSTAQQVCRGIGAQLASISTTDEQRFITANIRNSLDYTPRALYWLGGELAESGELEWADGARLMFEGWLPGQKPELNKTSSSTSSKPAPICLGLQWKISPTPMISSGLHWSSQKCSTVAGYVCKKPRPTAEENMAKNQTITGTEGRLVSPSPYPAQMDYWIRLVAPEASRIIVQFQKLDIEHQEECLYDYVSIQNYRIVPGDALNPGMTDPLAAAGGFWNNRDDDAMVGEYRSDSPFRNLLNGEFYYGGQRSLAASRQEKFHRKRSLAATTTDADIQQKLRDNIKLLEKINSKLKDRKKRFLSSDNYKTVKNSSQSITLESNSGAEPVIEDTDPSFLPYVRWCGTHDSNMTRFNFVSTGNEAFLRFHTDFSVSGEGFSATWSTVDISGCPVQTITSREGTIASPNYPHFLLNNLDCAFIIQAPYGKKVWLEFVAFDIGQNASVQVDIAEGPFEPFREASHINDGVFLSKGERMVVRLRTGPLPRGKGFSANFRTISASSEQQRSINLANKTTGNLFHLNYPQSVPSEVDFTQHLVAPLGEVILLELHGVGFSEHGCHKGGFIEIYDNYADRNGTLWHLCELNHNPGGGAATSQEQSKSAYSAEYKLIENNLARPAPIYITSYLNTLHVRQRTVQGLAVRLNATIRLQADIAYKMKLIANDEEWVEGCSPNPCQSGGRCITQKDHGICQCRGHFTGRFCGLTMCELEPCYFGKCELTASSFKCHCQPGYMGQRCDEKPKPCEDNPCEGRGECHPKNGGFFCRCHAWWEGARCEKRMMHIPYKPLSERMLQEPFWLGLITVFVVLAVIGLVWCAKRHFPEKIEKLLADEAHRNRTPFPPHHLNTALREQLQAAAGTVPSSTATTPAAARTIFGRLGTPSPRKKRNNSTPTKKNVNEKKQILQQLVSPAPNSTAKQQVSLGELIQLSENRLKVNHAESESDLKETTFSEHSLSVSSMVRQISDPKLEKKVTFARLLSKVSAEMSSGSEDLANGTKHSSALSLPTEVPQRANSVPPSPSTNEIRSPHSTSSNQGSDSLSSSELALHDFGLRSLGLGHGHPGQRQRVRPKVSSADSILAMFKNFATSSAGINLPSSIVISPSSTPTASSPQDDVAGDDDSSTSSIHTPVSYSSGGGGGAGGGPDSPVFYRQSTIEVPVLDALSAAHKTTTTTTTTTQLHPPTILLEIPSNGINNKCLSPIREMPTPIPSPALTPIMPRPARNRSPQAIHDESMSVTFSGDYAGYNNPNKLNHQVTIEINQPESDTDSPTPTNFSNDSTTSSSGSSKSRKPTPPRISISIDVQPPTPERERAQRPRDLVIPELIIQQPSPTRERTAVVMFPGSPPPQRASIGETSSFFPNKQQQKRLLKQWEKPGSLDLPFEPPMITITSNMAEVESDADCMSPAPTGKPNGINPTTLGVVSGSSVGMCYLSPFSMCTRGDRAPSESNLSSSGYSSMASPGPSRCGSSNPLCPSEMEDPGSGSAGTGFPGLGSMMGATGRRQTSSILKKHNDSSSGGTSAASGGGGGGAAHDSFRLRSDSETLSDDPLLESNDEGIGTDHLDEKIEEGEIRSAKELELYIGKELIETGNRILHPEASAAAATMSQLQLPSIVIQTEGFDKLSPVSSRSESPLSDRTASMERFSPLFYGKKDQQLPFTDSDGLYDFPSSDGKGSSATATHHRKSTGRRRDRRSSSRQSLSPSKSTSVLLEIPGGGGGGGSKDHNSSTYNSHGGGVTVAAGAGGGSKYYSSTTTPTRKSPKRRPLYRHPVASSSSSTESLTSTREYAQRSSKAFVTFTKETQLCDSGDDTGEVRSDYSAADQLADYHATFRTSTSYDNHFLAAQPPSSTSPTTTTTTTATTVQATTYYYSPSSSSFPPPPPSSSKQPEAPPRFASAADSDLFRRLLNFKLDKLTVAPAPTTSSGGYTYTRICQSDDDDDADQDDDYLDDDWDCDEDDFTTTNAEEEDEEFDGFEKDVSSQILPKVTVEDSSSNSTGRPQSKIGRLRAIGNQIRFLRRLERSIRQKDRLIAVASDEDGSPKVTSPLLKKPEVVAGGVSITIEVPPGERGQQQQLLMPSSAAGVKSRQNFKMSRQKRVANSRSGGGYSAEQQPWLEREHKLLGSADVNSD